MKKGILFFALVGSLAVVNGQGMTNGQKNQEQKAKLQQAHSKKLYTGTKVGATSTQPATVNTIADAKAAQAGTPKTSVRKPMVTGAKVSAANREQLVAGKNQAGTRQAQLQLEKIREQRTQSGASLKTGSAVTIAPK